MRVLIQSRIDETNCAFSCTETLFVDQIDVGGENGGSSTSTTNKAWLAADVEKDVQTDRRDIRVSTARLVIIWCSVGG
jgi:hypothetical protein